MRTIKRRKPKKRVIKRRSDTARAAADVSCSLGLSDDKAPVEFVHSGSTRLNLAISMLGPKGGWPRARIINIVGDGSSGKTLLALEAAFSFFKRIKKTKSKIFPKVKKLYIVYVNREGVMDFPIRQMYGPEFEDFVEWEYEKKNVEQAGRDYARRLKALKKGECLLYIIDSWDSLGSSKGDERFEKSIKEDKDLEGSYNVEKQKYASTFFSNICGKMEKNSKDATLVIISQVRTKIGVTFGKKHYRAGGKALDFYTHVVAWIREMEKMRATKRGEKRVYGIKCEVKIDRSKVAKPFRESQFTILYDYGLDDVSSMADYLWGPKKDKTIKYNGKEFKKRHSLITYIEENNLEEDIAQKCEEKWTLVEEAFTKSVKKRKNRF